MNTLTISIKDPRFVMEWELTRSANTIAYEKYHRQHQNNR